MTALATETGRDGLPEPEQLAQVRGQHWMVASVAISRQPIDELAASSPPGRTLDGIDDEQARELAAIESRYASVRELGFPFAVAVCVPDGERP